MISAGPVPTDAEYEAYGKLTGVAQGVNNVTFYCNEKPTTELKIRAFCGVGSDEGTDLSIIGEGQMPIKATPLVTTVSMKARCGSLRRRKVQEHGTAPKLRREALSA